MQRRHAPGNTLSSVEGLVIFRGVVMRSKPLERPGPVHRRGDVDQGVPVHSLRGGRGSAADQRVRDVEALAHDRRLAQGREPELVDGIHLGSVPE